MPSFDFKIILRFDGRAHLCHATYTDRLRLADVANALFAKEPRLRHPRIQLDFLLLPVGHLKNEEDGFLKEAFTPDLMRVHGIFVDFHMVRVTVYRSMYSLDSEDVIFSSYRNFGRDLKIPSSKLHALLLVHGSLMQGKLFTRTLPPKWLPCCSDVVISLWECDFSFVLEPAMLVCVTNAATGKRLELQFEKEVFKKNVFKKEVPLVFYPTYAEVSDKLMREHDLFGQLMVDDVVPADPAARVEYPINFNGKLTFVPTPHGRVRVQLPDRSTVTVQVRSPDGKHVTVEALKSKLPPMPEGAYFATVPDGEHVLDKLRIVSGHEPVTVQLVVDTGRYAAWIVRPDGDIERAEGLTRERLQRGILAFRPNVYKLVPNAHTLRRNRIYMILPKAGKVIRARMRTEPFTAGPETQTFRALFGDDVLLDVTAQRRPVVHGAEILEVLRTQLGEAMDDVAVMTADGRLVTRLTTLGKDNFPRERDVPQFKLLPAWQVHVRLPTNLSEEFPLRVPAGFNARDLMHALQFSPDRFCVAELRRTYDDATLALSDVYVLATSPDTSPASLSDSPPVRTVSVIAAGGRTRRRRRA